MEMDENYQLYFSHISVTWMVAQGPYRLSWVNVVEGEIKGQQILDFLLYMHKSALDIRPTLLPWLKSWMGDSVRLLTP